MKERIHAIDALRVFAMLSVIFLHGAISYMTVRLPDLLWAAHDPNTAPFFDGLFFWIRGLTMRIFFLVAGFFAAKLYEDLGPHGFIENRARRILVPFLVGTGILLPLVYFIWCWGWLRAGEVSLSEVLRTRYEAPIQRNIYGPIHLWFLECLIIYYAVFFALRKLRFGIPEGTGRLERILFSPLRPFYLALPSILILWFNADVVINFRNTFVPSPLKLIYYGVFFWVGARLYRFRGRLGEYANLASAYLLASIPVFFWMERLLRRHLETPVSGLDAVPLVISISLFAWLSVFAFFGLFMRFLNRPIPLVRYLSGASYWIYLCHLPIVGVSQVMLMSFDSPAVFKFIAVIASALAFGFLSYEWFVRRTLIGACLTGPKSDLWAGPGPLAMRPKIILSALLLFFVTTCGVSFQRFYNEEESRTRQAVTGFYWKYLHRAPDAVGLRHWTDWALCRWGLAKAEEEGFAKMARAAPKGNF